jgi:hypothetical protein
MRERTVNIAMWSGPRNISTAMMYSFGNRPDCLCWDEPFYGFSLARRGNDHPLRDKIIAAWGADFDAVVQRCLAAPPPGRPVFYQKHMTHHMLKGVDRSFVHRLTNAFLIRSPERVLESYVKKWPSVTLQDIGFVEQAELFDMVAERLGKAPPVVDADDILSDPEGMLRALCQAIGIPFRPEMLSWPAGPKSFDGVWAPHWYNAVWMSTGFEQRPSAKPVLAGSLEAIAEAALPYYEALLRHRLVSAAAVSPVAGAVT